MTAKKKHALDLLYRRKYGRTYKEINRLRTRQKNRCAICRWTPTFNKKTGKKHNNLAIDHWHKLSNLKVKVFKTKSGLWEAYNVDFRLYKYHLPEGAITFKSHLRKKAVNKVKYQLKRKSVRGLICWRCNSGLRKWLDNPTLLRRAGKYLSAHQSGGKL